MIVVVEGGDACGKNTLCQSLREWGKDVFKEVWVYSFPQYDQPFGKIIKEWLSTGKAKEEPLAFQAMMTTDRYSVASEIAHRGGHIQTLVIIDRWWQSSYVYGVAQGLDSNLINWISSRLPKADLNLLLDLHAEVASARRPEKRDSYEKDFRLMQAVGWGYRELWYSKEKYGNWIKIDARQSPDAVLKEAAGLIRQRKSEF